MMASAARHQKTTDQGVMDIQIADGRLSADCVGKVYFGQTVASFENLLLSKT
jgi:hypothetical protein